MPNLQKETILSHEIPIARNEIDEMTANACMSSPGKRKLEVMMSKNNLSSCLSKLS